MKNLILLIVISWFFIGCNQKNNQQTIFRNQSVLNEYKDPVTVIGIVVLTNNAKRIDTAPFVYSSYPNPILTEKIFYMISCTKI